MYTHVRRAAPVLAVVVMLLCLPGLIGGARATVVCRDFDYRDGLLQPAQFGKRLYVYARLDWLVPPPVAIRLRGAAAPLTFEEFALSYPWATALLPRFTTPLSYALTLIRLAPPEPTANCPSRVDAINLYWSLAPSDNLFASYPIRCNDAQTQLMFAVDPAAHPGADRWGDTLQWPTNGRHFVPQGGRDSFEAMLGRARAAGAEWVPFTLAYHSGTQPNLEELAVRSCVDVDVAGLGAALLAQFNATISAVEQAGAQKRQAAAPATDPPAPDPNDERANNLWMLDRLRREGVRVDLPRIGKLAPPEPTRPPRAASPYDLETSDADAVLEPGQQLASAQDLGQVSAAQNARAVVLDGRLWPFLQCVQRLGDGTCMARFGYVLAADAPVVVPTQAPEENWFEPVQYLTDFVLPTTFEPGRHLNGFVIRWFCVGATFGTWNTIYWTLKGSTATALSSSPQCNAGQEDAALLSEVQNAFEAARRNPGLRTVLSLDGYGDTGGNRDGGDGGDRDGDTGGDRDGGAGDDRDGDNTGDQIAGSGGDRDDSNTPGRATKAVSSSISSSSATACTATACDGVLQPRLECTHNFENGTCVSYWGYLNTDNATVFRAPGFASDNFFTPGAADLGQPGAFLPGRHYYVLVTYWTCGVSSGVPQSLSWVMNTTATASSATHNTCPVGCDGVPFSGAITCAPAPPPPGSSSTGHHAPPSYASSTLGSSGVPATTPPLTRTPAPPTTPPAYAASTSGYASSTMGLGSSSSIGGGSGLAHTPRPPPACAFGAALVLYSDRNFTTVYRPPQQQQQPAPGVPALAQPYGLVSLEVPAPWLADFCLDVSEVVECLCNTTARCHAFDPRWPGVTGCNSPGVRKRVLYRRQPAAARDGFAFVANPPAYCSGQRAFTWTQQLVAPPGNKLLVQAHWSYSTLHGAAHNCTGSAEGGSGATFDCCECPATHAWRADCDCCAPRTGDDHGTSDNEGADGVINLIDIDVTVNTGGDPDPPQSIVVNVHNDVLGRWWVWLLVGIGACLIPVLLAAAVLVACCCCWGPAAAPPPECHEAVVCETACPAEVASLETDAIVIYEMPPSQGLRIPRPCDAGYRVKFTA